MGMVHVGIIMDTLPWVLNHSSLPLKIHMGGMGSFLFNVGWNIEWNKVRFHSNDSEHQELLPHKLVYNTMHTSTTQMHNLSFKPNVLKEVAYTLVPPFTKISSNPSCRKFTPIHDLGVEANQKFVGVNTSIECCM